MKLLTIDFETYFDNEYSLSKMSMQEYIRDPRFKVHGVSIKAGNYGSVWVTEDIKHILSLYVDGKVAIIAHNAIFDVSILEWHYKIPAPAVICTLGLSRALLGGAIKSHSLDSVATHLLGYGKGAYNTTLNEVKGCRDLSDYQKIILGERCNTDADLTYKIATKLLPHIPVPELRCLSWTVRAFTRPLLRLDPATLGAHLDATRKAKEGAFAAAGLASRDMLMSNPQFAEALTNLGVTPPVKESPTTGKLTYAFAKTDEEFTALQDHENPQVQAIVAARLECKSTIEETRTETFLRAAEFGAFPVGLKYSGAEQTHRLSGDGGNNIQNLRRKGELRRSIMAPEGSVILVGDLKQIELRVAMLLAGETGMIDILGSGADPYQDFANEVCGGDRQLAKTCLLGNQYGQGHVKFASVAGIPIEQSKEVVGLYRKKYAGIPDCWDECNDIIRALYFNETGTWKKYTYGKHPVTGQPALKSPAGLWLQYPELGLDGKQYMYTSKGKRFKIYGSALFGHLVQHLARCVIMEHLLKIDKVIPVVLQVHDEIVCVVKEANAEVAAKVMKKIMSTPPAWWPELPLVVDVSYAYRYGDAK